MQVIIFVIVCTIILYFLYKLMNSNIYYEDGGFSLDYNEDLISQEEEYQHGDCCDH